MANCRGIRDSIPLVHSDNGRDIQDAKVSLQTAKRGVGDGRRLHAFERQSGILSVMGMFQQLS